MLSQAVQFLSRNGFDGFPGTGAATTGIDQVSPPSVERFTTTSTTAGEGGSPDVWIPRDEIIQTLWRASNATVASLARSYVPPAKTVMPGSDPWLHVEPPSVEVANPTSEAPPLKNRPC